MIIQFKLVIPNPRYKKRNFLGKKNQYFFESSKSLSLRSDRELKFRPSVDLNISDFNQQS